MLIKCKVCGKDAEWSGRGRQRQFCSMHCKNIFHKDAAREYYRKRIQEDAEFRERRLAASRNNSARSMQLRRHEVLTELAKEVYAADSVEEVYELLDSRVRSIKASNA